MQVVPAAVCKHVARCGFQGNQRACVALIRVSLPPRSGIHSNLWLPASLIELAIHPYNLKGGLFRCCHASDTEGPWMFTLTYLPRPDIALEFDSERHRESNLDAYVGFNGSTNADLVSFV